MAPVSVRQLGVPFLPSHPDDAAPPTVFKQYPEIYRAWAVFSEAVMNGPGPLGQDERELLFAYAAGVAGSEFVAIAHAEVAYARGIKSGLVEEALDDLETARMSARLRILLRLVRDLMLAPQSFDTSRFKQARDAGWSQQAVDSVTMVAARAAFMATLARGFGFTPLTREAAAHHAKHRVQLGYVNLYSQFRDRD
jgi:alkylhydroperoxidase family enzyme